MTRFVFHHIPKSGGTSVRRAAEAAGFTEVAAQNPESDSLPEFLVHGDFLSSHFLFADYDPAPGDVYFTWLRDPIDMFFSGYHYWRMAHVEVVGFEFSAPMVEFMRGVARHPSARDYVDAVLDERPRHVFPRGLFTLPWERFHFIGRTDRMADSIAVFNDRFGTSLEPLKKNSTGRGPVKYRRGELEQFFAPELEAFNAYCDLHL